MELALLFYVLLFVVAFLYSSVGHGGASGYLALMALYGMAPTFMKPTALLLNIFVAGIAFIQYYRAGHFQAKIFALLAVTSVPAAFLGGMMTLDNKLYKLILGVCLVIAAIRFIFFSTVKPGEQKPYSNIGLGILGAVIGLISGMIGIGGGVILAPVLLLLKWTDQKQTAAICAAFILVNSISGLVGQLVKGVTFTPDMFTYVAVATVGGLIGSYFGSVRFHQAALKYILATVLAVASYKLMFV